MNKLKSLLTWKKFAGLLIIIMFLSAFKKADDYFEISKNLEIFTDVYKEVNDSYVDETKPGALMKTGINAMLASLDPYTNFYSESEAEDAMFLRTGEYGGIGCGVIKRDNYIYISVIYEGHAADKAGLRIGDKVLEINGKSFVGATMEEISTGMRGASNTKASMVVERNGEKVAIDIIREDIKLKNVPYYGLINNETGYIKLEQFRDGAAMEVRNALTDLKTKGIKQVMLDLRGNGGGLLHEAVNIVNIFVDKNVMVTFTKGRIEEMKHDYLTLDNATDKNIPLIVLVNDHSASASEIVCGAIQDLDRGIVIGRNTYGKGLVQSTRQLAYRTQMKLTTAKYYIPSGRCIQLLDYTHRKKDGSASVVPDSLRKAFKTKNGRIVFDGGGVRPDYTVKDQKQSVIATALINNYLIFDFATQYRSTHETIAGTKSFKVDDETFEAFKTFISSKNYQYSTESETLLKTLKEKAKDEKYLGEIEPELLKLEKTFAKAKLDDVNRNKAEIKELLETEIARRYYNEKAEIETSFDNDPDVIKGLEILNDQALYSKTLMKI